MTPEPEAILFDLGGVLIELDGPPIKNHWLQSPISYRQSWQRWGASDTVQAFETGKLSANDFVKNLVREQNLIISEAEFRQAFIEWPKSFLAGAEALLQSLQTQYFLAFYSNTSELHLPRLMDDVGLGKYFQKCFASYQIGYFKPDLAGYAYVAAEMGFAPQNILFIDDNPDNVAGAKKAGLRAFQAKGTDEVRRVLHSAGCL